jgi:hypothetical protein
MRWRGRGKILFTLRWSVRRHCPDFDAAGLLAPIRAHFPYHAYFDRFVAPLVGVFKVVLGNNLRDEPPVERFSASTALTKPGPSVAADLLLATWRAHQKRKTVHFVDDLPRISRRG